MPVFTSFPLPPLYFPETVMTQFLAFSDFKNLHFILVVNTTPTLHGMPAVVLPTNRCLQVTSTITIRTWTRASPPMPNMCFLARRTVAFTLGALGTVNWLRFSRVTFPASGAWRAAQSTRSSLVPVPTRPSGLTLDLNQGNSWCSCLGYKAAAVE